MGGKMSKEYYRQWYANLPPDKKADLIKRKFLANQKRLKENPAASETKKKYDKSDKGIYARYKNDCKRRGRLKRGITMELSLNEFSIIIKKSCVFCGELSRGIDRIDPAQSYTKENSQPCCSSCNEMKNDKTEQQFIEHLKKIIKNRSL